MHLKNKTYLILLLSIFLLSSSLAAYEDPSVISMEKAQEYSDMGFDYYYGRNGKPRDYGQAIYWWAQADELKQAMKRDRRNKTKVTGKTIMKDTNDIKVSEKRRSTTRQVETTNNNVIQQNNKFSESKLVGLHERRSTPNRVETTNNKSIQQNSKFSDRELAGLYERSLTNDCNEKWMFRLNIIDQKAEYSMVRLKVFPNEESKQVYLVGRTDSDAYGRARNWSAMLLRNAGRMNVIEERLGLNQDIDESERIARNILGITKPGESRLRNVQGTVIFPILCIAALCVPAMIITRKLVSGLSVWQRTILQSTSALICSYGLFFVGFNDQIDLISIPLAAGWAVNLVFSIKDSFT